MLLGYGIGIWGGDESWKYLDTMRARYCKRSLNLSGSTYNDVARCEMVWQGSSGLILTRIIRYYNYIIGKGDNEVVKISLNYRL